MSSERNETDVCYENSGEDYKQSNNDDMSKKDKMQLLARQELPTQNKRDEIVGPLQAEEETSPETCPVLNSNENQFSVESETGEEAPRLRRNSSLKGFKSSPMSPGLPKAVHFADAVGMDLAYVKQITSSEDPPEIPFSALADLHIDETLPNDNDVDDEELTSFYAASRIFVLKFIQPGRHFDFLKQVTEKKVLLESCEIDNIEMRISGIVRVSNIGYHKHVAVHFTFNNWLTQEIVQAAYMCDSCDGSTDRFSFTISLPEYFEEGMAVQFALMYSVGGMTFWDNNFGANYYVECQSRRYNTSEQV